MSDARGRMVDDFAKQLSSKVQELVQREVNIARFVYTPAEIALITVELATAMQLSAVLVAVQVRKDEVDPLELFDLTTAMIATRIQKNRPQLTEVMEMVERLRGGATSK